MRILRVSAAARPLALRAPFAVSKRTALVAENVVVTVFTDGPERGFGASVAASYVTGETAQSVVAAIERAAPYLEGAPVENLGPLLDRAAGPLADEPSARAGLEMALYDLWAKGRGLRLSDFFGGRLPSLVTDLTIPLVTPDEAAQRAREAVSRGYTAFKLKVGAKDGIDADLARLAAVAAAAPEATLRLDANQAYTPKDALRMLHKALAAAPRIEMFEQPVDRADLDGLREVTLSSPVPVYADEAVCTPADAIAVIRAGAASGINVKLMKSGIVGALRIAEVCQAAGIGLMFGCMLESPLGISAAAQIAAGVGGVRFVDLDTHELLAPIAWMSGGVTFDGSRIAVDSGSAAGWGVWVGDEPAED